MQQNMFVQFSISNNTTASLGYVGTELRHLAIAVTYSGSPALLPPGLSTQPYQPFPDFGGTRNVPLQRLRTTTLCRLNLSGITPMD